MGIIQYWIPFGGLFIIYLFIYLFIHLWLCWVFSARGLSPAAASGGHSSSRCAGLSLSWPLLLRSIGSRRAGSVVVAHGPSCSAACGIFPGQGSNPCPLHWQADSQPLHHQGSPWRAFKICQVIFHPYLPCPMVGIGPNMTMHIRSLSSLLLESRDITVCMGECVCVSVCVIVHCSQRQHIRKKSQ